MTSNQVNNFLADLALTGSEQLAVVNKIRELFNGTNTTLIEDIKYGGLVFNLSNRLIGGIYVYQAHISIEFSNGADFIDNDKLLEGSGKRRRHLKIRSLEDIVNKKSEYFIAQAVAQ